LGLGPPKTAGSRRRVDLDAKTVEVLRRHRGRMGGFSDFVFAADTDRPMDPDVVSQTFRKLVEEAGLPRISLHALRDTWATLAMEAGEAPKVVAERLGVSVTTTMRKYSHVSPTTHARPPRG
jgi:integrase